MRVEMFPTKSTSFDHMAEYQRLWPRAERNAANQMQLNQSPFRSVPANRSSSSTDSTSPESYFDHSFIPELNIRIREPRSTIDSPLSSTAEYQPLHNVSQPIFNTPVARHQRPILGRKISPDTQYISNAHTWQKQTRNYELFPNESLEQTPPKNPMPSNLLNTHVQSPIWLEPKTSPIMNPIIFERPASSLGIGESKICTFCKKNGERPKVYMTHWVKEKVGSKYVVTCPVLRSHVCSQCGESGDNAHTITYCPVLRTSNNGKPLQSTTITLKNTRVLSNGKKRYTKETNYY